MRRRACSLLVVVLAMGLVVARRRLSEVEAELERMRPGPVRPRTPLSWLSPLPSKLAKQPLRAGARRLLQTCQQSGSRPYRRWTVDAWSTSLGT
jgi:hypothetical protein